MTDVHAFTPCTLSAGAPAIVLITIELYGHGVGPGDVANHDGLLARSWCDGPAFRNADESTPIATTTTDAQGNYALTITLNGEAIDGFLKATKTGFLATYLYPPYPLDMDFNMASVILVTQQTFETLSNVAGGGQMTGKGLIGLIVTDGTNPVGGATASSNPAASVVRYNTLVGNQVLPLGQTSTHTDGVAYLFNLPPGQVTVSAAKTGSTFASHNVKAWADQLTTTVVVP